MIKKFISVLKKKKVEQGNRLVYTLVSDDVDLSWDSIEEGESKYNTTYFIVRNLPVDRGIYFTLKACDERIKNLIRATAILAEEYSNHYNDKKIDCVSISALYSELPSTMFVIEYFENKSKSICFVIEFIKDTESLNRYEYNATILTAPNKSHSAEIANSCLAAIKEFLPIKVEHGMFLSNDINKDMQDLFGDHYNTLSLQVVSSQNYVSPLLNKKKRKYIKLFSKLNQKTFQKKN